MDADERERRAAGCLHRRSHVGPQGPGSRLRNGIPARRSENDCALASVVFTCEAKVSTAPWTSDFVARFAVAAASSFFVANPAVASDSCPAVPARVSARVCANALNTGAPALRTVSRAEWSAGNTLTR